ncbi:MAG: hypothetical protein IKN29_04115 [Bacteroidales bacterium]|nr:hypothetical protein [Bacteroidales bacterium]
MIDGGMTVFAVGGREFCLKEMMREVAEEYAEGRCTLGEFCDMYEGVALAAIGITEKQLQEELRRRREGGCGGAAAYA